LSGLAHTNIPYQNAATHFKLIPHLPVCMQQLFIRTMSSLTKTVANASTTSTTKALSPLIDIGCNLLDPMFNGVYHGKTKHEDDFKQVLERGFQQAGVEKIIITAGTLEEARNALELARTDSRLYSTVGVHPTRCSDEFMSEKQGEIYLENMIKLATEGKKEGKIVAVGEFGLDYDRTEFCPKEIQQKWFKRQLVSLASEVDLPLFLHCRAASDDMIEILKEHNIKNGVVHSFDGTMETMLEMCALGLSIGVNGCSLRTDDNLNVVKNIPIDRLLLETDGPWCDIRPSHPGHQYIRTNYPQVKNAKKFVLGKCVKNRQEPCHLRQVLEVVAGVRNVNPDELAKQIYKNTLKLFPGLCINNCDVSGSNSGGSDSSGNGNDGGSGNGNYGGEKRTDGEAKEGDGSGGSDAGVKMGEMEKSGVNGSGNVNKAITDDDVQPFTLEDNFDYDHVVLSGRKQTKDGWKEFNTGACFNDYIESAGGEDKLIKQIAKLNTKPSSN
jgi:TatD DNase family protein